MESLSGGVSVQGAFCLQVSVQGSLSRGLCSEGFLSGGTLSGGSLSRGSLSRRSLSGGLWGSLSGESQ